MSDRPSTPPPRGGRSLAFAVTWVAYATYYLGRKGFSVAKATMSETLGLSLGSLAAIDTAYLAAYAVGQLPSGILGDRFGARRLVGLGMLASAAACALFGSGTGTWLFMAAFVVNGLAQSTGWPGTTKAMAEWTTKESRGVTMGLWATCYQVGGFVATVLAARLLAEHGWRGAFLGPAAVIAIVGVLVLLLLRPGPGAASAGAEALRETPREERRRVMRSPTVWSYGAAYFCIKLVRYSFLGWLPYYLKTQLHYDGEHAGYLSTSFEIGGVAGTIAIGLLSDRMKHVPRSVVSAICLVGLAGALVLYAKIGSTGTLTNFATMALVGFLLFGPDALLSGAATQDAGGPYAAATATGLVNGIGSLGAVLQGVVTVQISRVFGWDALFVAFAGLAVVAALCLAPTFRPKPAPAES